MAVTNPFTAGPPSPPPRSSNGIINPFTAAAGAAIHAVNPVDAGDSPSVGGFLGNIVGGAKGIVEGIVHLGGAAVHDTVEGVKNLIPGEQYGEAEGYKLDDIAAAMPGAIVRDYSERYGWDDFSKGDIWGGIQSIFSGFYKNPLAYLGDALMVAGGASEIASAGRAAEIAATGSKVPLLGRLLPETELVGDTAAKAILGPGSKELMSLTGSATEPTQLSASLNPVTRAMQSGIHKIFTISPDRAAVWAARFEPGGVLQDIGKFDRAQTAMITAESRGLNFLRPGASQALENRWTSRAMSAMGLSVRDKTSALNQATLKIVNDLDGEGKALLPDVMQGTLPARAPVVRTTSMSVDGELEARFADTVLPQVTAGPRNVGFLRRLSQMFKTDPLKDEPSLSFRILDPSNRDMPIYAPHDMTGVDGTRVLVYSMDPTLSDAGSILRQVEQGTGHEMVGFKNYFQDSGSYEGVTGMFRDPETGAISEVNVATPALAQEQVAWAHTAGKIDELSNKISGARAEIAALEHEGPEAAAQIQELEAQIVAHEDELDAAQYFANDHFAFTRRSQLEANGEVYDPIAKAADQVNTLVHNGASRVELDHGLTYRKALDRAFLPMRSVRWQTMMRDLEQELKITYEAVIGSGGKPADAMNETMRAIDRVLGAGNPSTVKAIKEAIFHSQADELIPFRTGEVMPGTGEELGGVLATGETKILGDNAWWGPKGATDPAAGAKYVTDRLRRLTHEAIVENGEFPTFTWKDMAAQVEADPMQQMPRYYPHLKAGRRLNAANLNLRGRQTQIFSETARMEKNEASLFEQGLYERDPIQATSRLYAQVQRHSEYRDALLEVAQKYGRTPTEEELKQVALNPSLSSEVYLSENGIHALLDARKEFMTLKHEGMMAGQTPELATIDALDQMSAKTLAAVQAGEEGAGKIWAVPSHVANLMDRFGRETLGLPPKASFFYNTIMNAWKTSVLGLSPRWLVNNTLGNLVYMGVKDPGAIRYYLEMLMPSRRAYVEAMFGDSVTAGVYRDFIHGESLSTKVPLTEKALDAGAVGTAEKLDQLSQAKYVSDAGRGVSWAARKMFAINEWNEQAARMSVAISAAQRARQLGVMSKFDSTFTAMKKIQEGGVISDAQYGSITKAVDETLGDYLRLSPTETAVKRYLAPFYPFYRHTAMFIARMPFESPFKAMILNRVREIDKDMSPTMPDYMAGAFEIMPGMWVRMGNANPLQAVTEAYAPAITNPLLGLGIQRITGTNPFGEPWTPPPGQVVETGAGDQYEILRNSDGSFAGVRPVTGQWEPPLASTLMNMIPQYGLITGGTPFKPKPLWARGLAMSGVSVTDFDQQAYAMKQYLSQNEALGRGARASVRYP